MIKKCLLLSTGVIAVCKSILTPEAPTNTWPTNTFTTTIKVDSNGLTLTYPPSDTPTPSSTETASPTLIPTVDYFSSAYPLRENENVIPLTVRHITDESATFFFELQNSADGILVNRNSVTRIQEDIPFSLD